MASLQRGAPRHLRTLLVSQSLLETWGKTEIVYYLLGSSPIQSTFIEKAPGFPSLSKKAPMVVTRIIRRRYFD